MHANSSRRLIWIPVIHTQADLGSMSEALRRRWIRTIGRRKWQEHSQAVARMWQAIREEIGKLDLDYGQVRLYQDGLPICGHEEEIVRHVAQAGSVNHQILLELMGKGARLMGTESPELLLEEYNLARQTMRASAADRSGQRGAAGGGSPGASSFSIHDRYRIQSAKAPASFAHWSGSSVQTPRGVQGQRELSEQLIARRDRAIAERIDQTLLPGETGLLFLGMLHALEGYLPADILWVHPASTGGGYPARGEGKHVPQDP